MIGRLATVMLMKSHAQKLSTSYAIQEEVINQD